MTTFKRIWFTIVALCSIFLMFVVWADPLEFEARMIASMGMFYAAITAAHKAMGDAE